MVTYIIRRLILAVPALIFISFIIFMIVKLSPSDPTANLPLTIPPEVREQIRESLGVNEPLVGQYLRWARMMFITEPLIMLEDALCSEPRLAHRVMPEGCWQIVPPDTSRIISYQTRSPVFDLIAVSLPQTLWVVGSSYIIGILIGMPLGIISAYKQYS
jgi:peptide/nickel transport system permease protein